MFKVAAALSLLTSLLAVNALPAARDNVPSFETFVVQRPNCTAMNDFGMVFSAACHSWLDGNGTDVSALASQFYPGGPNAVNADNQALANCVWAVHQPSETTIDVTKDIVEKMGGQVLKSGSSTYDDVAKVFEGIAL